MLSTFNNSPEADFPRTIFNFAMENKIRVSCALVKFHRIIIIYVPGAYFCLKPSFKLNIFVFQIVNRHGPEADRHLLRCLFSHVDFSGDGKSSGKDFHQVCRGYGIYKIYPHLLCKFAVLGIIYGHEEE